ncbi:MAG TPA: hypothetical protein VHK26_06640 [Methyloceanibacter sp.]|jgi:hypothetical protein|nr:hypothetical protein [Methyloceanibacter sp.]
MITREDVLHLCGELPDWKITKIIASEPSYAELETAVLWARGEDPGPDHHPLQGKVAFLFEVITAGEEWEEENRRG